MTLSPALEKGGNVCSVGEIDVDSGLEAVDENSSEAGRVSGDEISKRVDDSNKSSPLAFGESGWRVRVAEVGPVAWGSW